MIRFANLLCFVVWVGVLGWVLSFPVQGGEGGTKMRPLRILFYGNSFTRGAGSEVYKQGGVPELVKQLAESADFPAPLVENAAKNSQALRYHIEKNTGVIAKPRHFKPEEGFKWDYVVLQEFSTKPTSIGDVEAFKKDALELYEMVKEHSPNVRVVLFQTWARKLDGFPCGKRQFQQELRSSYEQAREYLLKKGAKDVRIARVGDKWQKLDFARDLYAKDNYHASARGSYLAALMLFKAIYKKNVVGMPQLVDSLSGEQVDQLQEIAEDDTPMKNLEPMVSAGQGKILGGKDAQSVEFDGLVVDENNGKGKLSIRWEQVDGPKKVKINNSSQRKANTILSASGTYTFKLTADDGEYSKSDLVRMTVLCPDKGGALVKAVNCGGEEYTGNGGVKYEKDTYVKNGWAREMETDQEIEGTDDDVVYQKSTYNFKDYSYSIPLKKGTYIVTLQFAEINKNIDIPGKRVFDIEIEGQKMIDDLDIFKQTGQFKAFDASFKIKVADGALDIALKKNPKMPVRNSTPLLSAIQIRKE